MSFVIDGGAPETPPWRIRGPICAFAELNTERVPNHTFVTMPDAYAYLPPPHYESFESRNYRDHYDADDGDYSFFAGVSKIHEFIMAVGEREGLDQAILKQYEKLLEKRIQALPVGDIATLAAVAWTTPDQLNGRELCSYINQAVIEDSEPMIAKVVPVCRILNKMVVTRAQAATVQWPQDFKTFRGIGMPEEHFGFFEVGRVYRTNMFLASSAKLTVAKGFAINNAVDSKKQVIFTIQFDEDLLCAHANYMETISSCKGEAEFLMPPYSGFRVTDAVFVATGVSKVTIYAFPDNKAPELANVPLAPWH